MTIQQQITGDITAALRARDTLRLEVLRSIKTAFTNELVSLKRTPQAELTDPEAITVIKRLAGQRQDAFQQFQAAGRNDLADKERAEGLIINEYLPTQLSDEELKTLVAETVAENPDLDITKLGILIGKVMNKGGDRVTGDRVKSALQSHFQG